VDFDFSLAAVPFRMQPGLRRVAPGTAQLTALAEGSALWHEKKRVMDAGRSRLARPAFDEVPALNAIAEHAREHGLPRPELDRPLELCFEEDLAVLDADDASLPWLCVCTPSHWAPEEKLGLPFAAVHAPVADADLLRAASQQLVQLVTGGGNWERFVWTITPSGRHDQHPKRHAREPWPDAPSPEAFAAACWLRWERQAFIRVQRDTRQAVFTIRVMLKPLVDAVARPADARRLHDSLASMSDAVLAYKNLTPARAPLLAWLAARMD
jgi:dimethylamine monooxygenase subunit A